MKFLLRFCWWPTTAWKNPNAFYQEIFHEPISDMTNIPLYAAFIYGEFNPSGLYGDITVEQLKTDSYSASTRNRLIAEAFYLTKDIEKYGSGFIRIRQAIADYPTMKYEFRNEGNGFYASLMYEKQKMSDGGRVGNDTLNLENDTLNLENDTLNHGNDTLNHGNDTLNIEDKILLMLKDNPHTTLSQMAEHMGVSRITVQRLLSLLQQQGRVLRIGARKNGYWQISEKK